MSRKVIGIGETILDIVFRNDQPTAAVPGGSTFNSMVSLGRMGVSAALVSETGNDRVGAGIRRFMEDNGVDASHVCVYSEGKSPVSLAFLNECNEAEYLFYKDYPADRLHVDFPVIEADDVVMFGSYFAINPALRPRVAEFLTYARSRGALLYYDINFRSTYATDAIKLMPAVIENMELADVVRGSGDDFRYLYGLEAPDCVYAEKVRYYCPQLICTAGAGAVSLRTACVSKEYPVPAIETVSTIGAGDNFNAGIVYGLLKLGLGRDDLATMDESRWDAVVRCGLDFSAEVCRNVDNYVSREFAGRYK